MPSLFLLFALIFTRLGLRFFCPTLAKSNDTIYLVPPLSLPLYATFTFSSILVGPCIEHFSISSFLHIYIRLCYCCIYV